ncbi:MAG TPA: hypothetical protein VEP73_12635, partial [Actinomycetota bacterium]|nr:hypothetical protein [Actinomycetota bacterium]
MSPSRELVPVPRPGGGRRGWRGWRGWRPRLDAAARLLCRVARSPLARRLALAMLLAAAAAGIVGLSYATADAQAVPARP